MAPHGLFFVLSLQYLCGSRVLVDIERIVGGSRFKTNSFNFQQFI